MKLEQIVMPHTTGREEGRRYRRTLIVINDFIVEDFKEADHQFMKRESFGFENMVNKKVEIFEKALGVRCHKIRGKA